MPPKDDEKIIINNGFMGGVFETQAALARCGKMASRALHLAAKHKLSDAAKERIVAAENMMEKAMRQLQKAASITEQAFEAALADDDSR